MKKKWLFISTVLTILLIGFFLVKPEGPIDQEDKRATSFSTTPSSNDISASFEIVTLGTTRSFAAPMYHNLSNDVYITSADPNKVHVKKADTTWGNFFETLPMEVTKNCLTTGTKQVFCTNETNKLKFFINDKEDSSALDREINAGDKLRIVYK